MVFFAPGRVHSSWLIAAGCMGFLLGVAGCVFFRVDLFASLWFVAAVGVGSVVVVWWRAPATVVLVILVGCGFGLWRGTLDMCELARYQPFMAKHVVLRGKVAEDVERGNSGELRLKIQDVEIGGQKLIGAVWTNASSRLQVKRSDVVVLEGTLKPGFGNFPASMTFAKLVKVERPVDADIARDIRDGFSEGVRKVLHEPAASLGLGYLTGQQSALPPELDEQLKVVGLTHIVVASGYNLTILVRFARRLFARFSKFSSTTLASAMIAGFVLVTGFSPSMSRAALVAGLSLATWYYGRAIHPLVLLPFAAAMTVVVNPLFLWGDLGWYLSFAAFVGVIIAAPLVHDYFWGNKPPGVVRQIFVDTLCAQLVTMPIIAFSFGSYALYALPANLLVLPLIPLTMLLTFIAGVAGLLAGSAAVFVGLPAEIILNYMVYVAKTIAELPGAQGEVMLGVELLAATYVVLMLLGVFLWRRTRHNFRGDSLIE